MSQLLDLKQVQERCSFSSVKPIQRMIADGLPIIRLNNKTVRIREEDLEAYLSRKSEAPRQRDETLKTGSAKQKQQTTKRGDKWE